MTPEGKAFLKGIKMTSEHDRFLKNRTAEFNYKINKVALKRIFSSVVILDA